MYMASRRRKARKSKRRRRKHNKRRRTQKGGNLFKNVFLQPAVPPGGSWEPGCTNGLRGGKYYAFNCDNCLPMPKSSVGEMYPGLHKRMERLTKGGSRKRRRNSKRRGRRRRRRSRRRRHRRRSRQRRRTQRGGGDGVGGSVRSPPVKQAVNNALLKARVLTPTSVKDALRSAGTTVGNITNQYMGERTQLGGDPMDQPIKNLRNQLSSLDDLDTEAGTKKEEHSQDFGGYKLGGKHWDPSKQKKGSLLSGIMGDIEKFGGKKLNQLQVDMTGASNL